MKSAGKARNNGLYRHIRTSKEIIRNLLNDLKKYINNNELDLSTLWDEISRLKTKFEYITISSDYHEVKVGDDTVLIEKADLYLND